MLSRFHSLDSQARGPAQEQSVLRSVKSLARDDGYKGKRRQRRGAQVAQGEEKTFHYGTSYAFSNDASAFHSLDSQGRGPAQEHSALRSVESLARDDGL